MNCIVLDQGNTTLKWGLFVNEALVASGRILDSNLQEELNQLHSKHSLPFFYSSVRSEAEQTDFLNRFSFCRIIPSENFPTYHYTSGEAGKDRLANVAGASRLSHGATSLVIDFGTCITYSIAKNNSLHSGVISLGAQSRLRAMHEFTGKLPSLNFSDTSTVFDNSTNGAMLSSVNFGILSELRAYIEEASSQFPGIQLVFTGSDSVHFAKQLNYRIFVELNLTLIGLYAISCANES
jgi:type III pantothenate kinase